MVQSLIMFLFFYIYQTVTFIIHAPVNACMDFCLVSEEFPMISCTPVLGSVNFNLTGVSVHCISFGWNVMLSWRRIARHPNYKRQQEYFLYLCSTFICRDLYLSQGDQNNRAVHQSLDRGFQVTKGARNRAASIGYHGNIHCIATYFNYPA